MSEEDKLINRKEAQQLIESAIRVTGHQEATMLDKIEGVVRKVLREELKDIGLRVDSEDHQEELREDFRHLRRWRKAVNSVASYVGFAVIAAVVGGAIWLFTQGLNFWNTRPPT